MSTFGRLDVAYNNAGVQNELAEAADQKEEDFDRVVSINLRGVWSCMKYELQQKLKKILWTVALFSLTTIPVTAHSKDKNDMPTDIAKMKILNPAELPSNPGPADYFTGSVQVTQVVQGGDPSTLSCGCVAFQPGARSAWHTHPKGQLLIVTDGTGLIQEWGKPIRKIQKGDMIWTPPGVKHWHGAAPTSAMSHTAIQETVNGTAVDWLEKVSDEQYSGSHPDK